MNDKMKVSPLSPDHSVSFESTGPVLDDRGFQITNDHSTLTNVAGKHVWLHRDKHHFTGNEVHMRYDHAIDMGLAQAEEPTPEGEKVPEVQPDAPVTALSQGQSGHKPDDVKPLPEDKKTDDKNTNDNKSKK